jgi:hypothetical protein
MDRDSGQPKLNAEMQTQWDVQVLHEQEGRRDELIVVTIPGDEPLFEKMAPTVFHGLRVDHYNISGGGAGLYFRADGVSPVASSRKDAS